MFNFATKFTGDQISNSSHRRMLSILMEELLQKMGTVTQRLDALDSAVNAIAVQQKG